MKKTTLLITFLSILAHTLLAYNSPDKIRIPNQVAESIKANAERQWPDDYSMQEYEIKEQSKAYKKVQHWIYQNRYNKVYKEIAENAQRQWHEDYTMQFYEIERQVEAFNSINK